MDQDEYDLFLAAMGDVKPLTKTDKTLQFQRQAITEAQLARQAAAQAELGAQNDELSLDAVEPIEPDAIIGWTRGGMQHGVYKNLRLGKYSIDARLDLHGLTVEQSRLALKQFISDCQRNDIRSALLLHGKGLNSKPFRGVLKSYVAKWLPCIPEVLAYHSAQPHHGGTGAVYILLKKSAKEKQANRERHQKR